MNYCSFFYVGAGPIPYTGKLSISFMAIVIPLINLNVA